MAETIAGYAALYDTETVIAGLFRGKTAAAQEDVPPALLGTLAKQRLQAVHYLRASHVERGCCGLREVGLEYREKRLSATDNHGSAIAAHLHHRVRISAGDDRWIAILSLAQH